MKTKRKILSIILSLLVFIQIFTNTKLNTLATSGVNTFSVETIDGKNCFVYSNPSALPNTFSVYWVYGGKVCTAPATKWLIVALNKKLGTTFTDNWFTDFNTYFISEIMAASSLAGDFFTGGATRVSNGSSVIGVAFNDLTGLTLENDIPSDATITTPSNCINVTYNILNNYIEDNPQTPVYIILSILNKDQAIERILTSSVNPYWTDTYNSINNYVSGNNIAFRLGKAFGVDYWQFNSNNSYNRVTYADFTGIFFNVTPEMYSTLTNDFSLTQENNKIELTDLFVSSLNIPIYFNNEDGTPATITLNRINIDGSNANTINAQSFYVYSNNGTPSNITAINSDGQITIYGSNLTPTQIKNNTYYQNYYTSTNYKNYNSTNDNSFNMSYQNINNSQQTNQNIYNETKTTTNQNIENNNYNIDQSVNDNSTTTIINNYYGDFGGGDDDPTPDPDPDDDDTIWKALLKAIAGFFEKIGELIATLLTGIFSIFTSILDAITSITEDFTSITSFISSFFSWLPAPITSLIVLGLGLALICAFLTWFKK